MNHVTNNAITANDGMFSYHPMPLYDDFAQSKLNFSKKLDLNLYCIKRPQKTCFIRVTNPDMVAWGIEQGDMLVVEKNDSLSVGDLVVLEIEQKMEIYEFFAHNNGEFVFFALSSKSTNIKTTDWVELPIIGTVTNTIHQIKPRNNTMKFAA
ncbi:MAG TPA: type VI secretion protein ImpA [Pasteurellaceae bacterium]|nr:type VI secretion protein ImpA [Pasteurellaceae bacterium]